MTGVEYLAAMAEFHLMVTEGLTSSAIVTMSLSLSSVKTTLTAGQVI